MKDGFLNWKQNFSLKLKVRKQECVHFFFLFFRTEFHNQDYLNVCDVHFILIYKLLL